MITLAAPMPLLEAVTANLLTPAVLFFVLGVLAAVLKTDLKLPESLYVTLTCLSIFLVIICTCRFFAHNINHGSAHSMYN